MAGNRDLAEELKNRARSLGVGEVRCITVKALRRSKKELCDQVTEILPGVNSVISFLIPIPRGALHILKDTSRGMPYYTRLAGIWGRFVDEISARISVYLEGRGFDAAPVFVCTPLEIRGERDFWGYASQIDLAVLSGLGWKGKNGLLLSPGYGPRIGVGTVLTNAVLEGETPSKVGKCPDDCTICIEKCPASALDGTGKVDRAACARAQAMTPISSMMAGQFSMKEHAPMIVNVGAVDEHIWYTCNACMIYCPIGQ